MENIKWKSLILNWIEYTGLVSFRAGQSITRLEETEIRSFFKSFRELLGIPEFAPAEVTDFLCTNYPDFELNSPGDEEPSKNLSRNDYIFIYSIFLHYGCVIRFNPDIQRASQALSASEQMAVTVFLNFFLSRNVLVTRSALSTAIREAIHSLDAGPLAKFYAEDENGNRGETFSTPKTIKLEQNSREIIRLRGQVGTVGFEMSYLEGLVRDRDVVIENMRRRESDLQREIEELKKSLVFGTTSLNDEDQPPRAENELVRKERLELRTLRKDNSMLEDKVANLLIELNHLTNDKLKMAGKLKTNAKDLKLLKERAAELTSLVEELNAEVGVKNKQIGELVETNMELESFITENRSLLNKNIDPRNNSSASFSRSDSPNSSMASLRSANLGSCVIDIQLKEKELENAALKAQLSNLNETSSGLRSGLERFLEENASFREQFGDTRSTSSGVGSVVTPRSSDQPPEKWQEIFQSLSRVLREKGQLEATVQGHAIVMLKFREERDALRKELTEKSEKSTAMEKELLELRETVKQYAETERKELESFRYEVKHLNDLMTVQKLEKASFKSAIEKGEEDLYAKIRKIGKMNVIIERLRFEKKRAENEQKETEANMSRLLDVKLEDARLRQVDLERKLAEQENLLAMKEKHVVLLEEKQRQLERSCEEAERRRGEREEEWKREMSRLQETVQSLEGEAAQLRSENLNLEAKIKVVRNNLRPSLSLDVDKMRAVDLDGEFEGVARERRSSACNQMTSTPRLSMKQKVRMDVALLKRRRISLLSPDEDGCGLTSSESDTAGVAGSGLTGVECICRSKGRSRQKGTRRDSLIFNSPCSKKRAPQGNNKSKTIFDRSAINRMQKLKRQKVFNKGRGSLKDAESGVTQLDSLLWDGDYDLLDLEGDDDFALQNNEVAQKNFHAILETERCDGEDLFAGDEKRGEGKEKAVEGSLKDGGSPEQKSQRYVRAEEANGSGVRNRSYSMNSEVHWETEGIPTPNVVHFGPRTSPQKRNLQRRFDIYLFPLSQHNLLKLIAVALVGIFICVFYQNVIN